MKTKTIITTVFFIAASLLGWQLLFRDTNPYPAVEWQKDYPGATDRYVTYTPVLKSDPNIKLGPTLGADYAALNFKDIDDDGIMEVIIETDVGIDFGETYTIEKHILKSETNQEGILKFTLVESKKIKHE